MDRHERPRGALFLYVYSAITLRDVVSSLVLPLFWLTLFVLAVRWFVHHPLRVIALRVIAISIWFAVILGY